MRHAAPAMLVLLWVSPGCGPCWSSGVTADSHLTATVQGQLADGRTFDNRDPGLEAPDSRWSLQFGMPTSSNSPPIAFPQDMIVTMPFVTRFSDGENHPLTVQLTVRQVPSGPSEIDLDDTRALVDGWGSVRGHLSITTLAQDCSHGNQDCLTEMHAGFSVSATERRRRYLQHDRGHPGSAGDVLTASRPCARSSASDAQPSTLQMFENLTAAWRAGRVCVSSCRHERARTFVGREAERAEIRAALARAAAGQGGLILLVGEPGIRKDAPRRTRPLTTRARWDSRWHGGGAGKGRHRLLTCRGRRCCARFRSLRRRTRSLSRPSLPELGAARLAAGEAAGFELLEAATVALTGAAARRPLLIVLDDLHAADAGSLRLLESVVRGLRAQPLLVLASYRDVEARLSPEGARLLGGSRAKGDRCPSRASRPARPRRWLRRGSDAPCRPPSSTICNAPPRAIRCSSARSSRCSRRGASWSDGLTPLRPSRAVSRRSFVAGSRGCPPPPAARCRLPRCSDASTARRSARRSSDRTASARRRRRSTKRVRSGSSRAPAAVIACRTRSCARPYMNRCRRASAERCTWRRRSSTNRRPTRTTRFSRRRTTRCSRSRKGARCVPSRWRAGRPTSWRGASRSRPPPRCTSAPAALPVVPSDPLARCDC